MNRKRRLFALSSVALTTGCANVIAAYPEYFQTTWTEDTQLHDGRVIPVRVTRTYQRLDRNSKYRDAVRRTTKISFDAGPAVGEFSLSVLGNIAMIDQKDSVWYMLVDTEEPRYRSSSPVAMSGLRLVHLEGNQVIANKRSRDLPKEFKNLNLMHLTSVEILDQYNGKHVTLKDKEEFRKKNNTAERDLKIFPTVCAKDGTC